MPHVSTVATPPLRRGRRRPPGRPYPPPGACGRRRGGAGTPSVFGAVQGVAAKGKPTGGESMSTTETGQVTGTKDKDYNILWFTQACLSNALRLETYIKDAERDGDNELAEFFRKAQSDSRKGAEQGKQMLIARLGR